MILAEIWCSLARRRPFNWAVCVALCLMLSACNHNEAKLGSRPVVKVNDSVLSAEDFSNMLAARLKAFNGLAAKDSGVIAQAKNSIVQDFIVQTVTQDWAQKNQIFVRKEVLDSELTKIRKAYPDDVAFRKALADEGQTYDNWESRLKMTVLERQVLDELRKQIKPPAAEELNAYYQANRGLFNLGAAVHLRQIVLKTENHAQLIKKELSAGKNFAELAKKFSITPEGAAGGDLGWIEKGTFDLFDTASKLAIGARTQVLKSPFGYHLIEVVGRRQAKSLAFEEARAKIEKHLTAIREQENYSRWLEAQILKARVFKDDEFLRKIYVQTRGNK